jgi:hypothetical protein
MLVSYSFQGDLAGRNVIPAYDGLQSALGLCRSNLIIANYLVEGKVRRKKFQNSNVNFHLMTQQEGSYEFIFDLFYNAGVYGAAVAPMLAGGVAGNLLTDLIKYTYDRVLGNRDLISPQIENFVDETGGDVEALVEAIEPSVRLGHTVINHGVMNININLGTRTEVPNIARLNATTKAYVNENVENEGVRSGIFSIASYDVNQNTGRAYHVEMARTIPFVIESVADQNSYSSILESITNYANTRRMNIQMPSQVRLTYHSVDAPDGRIKKIKVISARIAA